MKKNISTRCKSNRQIESLIVAAQNSIKRCIGLIGANGMQGVGLSMFSQVPQQLPLYFFLCFKIQGHHQPGEDHSCGWLLTFEVVSAEMWSQEANTGISETIRVFYLVTCVRGSRGTV